MNEGEVIDDLFNKLGAFGRYQIRTQFLVMIPFVISAVQAMSVVFIHYTLPHRCAIPGLPNDTYESQGLWHDELINASIPGGTGLEDAHSSCYLYVPHNGTAATSVNSTQEKCSSWVYGKTMMDVTVQSELNFVCDNRPRETVAQMAHFSGQMVGPLFFGLLADRFGRKPIYLISTLLGALFGVCSAFAPDHHSFAFMRFVVGLCICGTFGAGLNLILELVGTSKRMLVGIMVEYSWIVGSVSTAGLAYSVKNWNHLLLIASVPIFSIIPYFWIIPESPRWLLTSNIKGNREKGKKLMKYISEVNGRPLVEKDFEVLDNTCREIVVTDQGGLRILKSPRIVMTLLVVIMNWFSVSLGYAGISLNSGKLPGDLYVNYVLIQVVDLPAFTMLFTMDKLGRKIPHIHGMLLAGLSLLATVLVDLYADKDISSTQAIYVALNVIGKIGVASAYGDIFIWAAEMFPTAARNRCYGVVSTIGRLGAVVSPIIVNEARFEGPIGNSIPLLIFGVLCVCTGLLAVLLPDTANKPLPETIEEAENLTKFSRKKSTTAETTAKNGNLIVKIPSTKEIEDYHLTSL
ncbi:organic cation transporter protein-like [Lingula anatina]|uniref:Organic cation transporter protein-like n=1 Tax=Lingula anatina TaxID=7574 RepID=A0A2R2MRP7_LINAN|nr:organic cation transporter protein-like [Lingula anatina]|eukprot:XP_023932924.1 organic cation transporter protein-like [Lingula anatina]